ncbi:hypothetical protein GVAV_003172 [Gurleya vavrai]
MSKLFFIFYQCLFCSEDLNLVNVTYSIEIYIQPENSTIQNENNNLPKRNSAIFSETVEKLTKTVNNFIKLKSIDELIVKKIENVQEPCDTIPKMSKNIGLLSENKTTNDKDYLYFYNLFFEYLFEYYIQLFLEHFFINFSVWCFEFREFFLLIDLGKFYRDNKNSGLFNSNLKLYKKKIIENFQKNIFDEKNCNFEDIYANVLISTKHTEIMTSQTEILIYDIYRKLKEKKYYKILPNFHSEKNYDIKLNGKKIFENLESLDFFKNLNVNVLFITNQLIVQKIIFYYSSNDVQNSKIISDISNINTLLHEFACKSTIYLHVDLANQIKNRTKEYFSNNNKFILANYKDFMNIESAVFIKFFETMFNNQQIQKIDNEIFTAISQSFTIKQAKTLYYNPFCDKKNEKMLNFDVNQKSDIQIKFSKLNFDEFSTFFKKNLNGKKNHFKRKNLEDVYTSFFINYRQYYINLINLYGSQNNFKIYHNNPDQKSTQFEKLLKKIENYLVENCYLDISNNMLEEIFKKTITLNLTTKNFINFKNIESKLFNKNKQTIEETAERYRSGKNKGKNQNKLQNDFVRSTEQKNNLEVGSIDTKTISTEVFHSKQSLKLKIDPKNEESSIKDEENPELSDFNEYDWTTVTYGRNKTGKLEKHLIIGGQNEVNSNVTIDNDQNEAKKNPISPKQMQKPLKNMVDASVDTQDLMDYIKKHDMKSKNERSTKDHKIEQNYSENQNKTFENKNDKDNGMQFLQIESNEKPILQAEVKPSDDRKQQSIQNNTENKTGVANDNSSSQENHQKNSNETDFCFFPDNRFKNSITFEINQPVNNFTALTKTKWNIIKMEENGNQNASTTPKQETKKICDFCLPNNN